MKFVVKCVENITESCSAIDLKALPYVWLIAIVMVLLYGAIFPCWFYDRPESVAAHSVMVFVIFTLYKLYSTIDKLQKTVTDQQTQIADLKRELEEGKVKQPEP